MGRDPGGNSRQQVIPETAGSAEAQAVQVEARSGRALTSIARQS